MNHEERMKTLRKLGAGAPEIAAVEADESARRMTAESLFQREHRRMVEEMKKGGLIPPDFKVVNP